MPARSSGVSAYCPGLDGLLLLFALPHLLDRQPAAERAVVIPLVSFDLARELVGLAADDVEVRTEPVNRAFLIVLAIERIAAAGSSRHLAVFVVTCPHELRGRHMLERGRALRETRFLSPVLGGHQLPGAYQFVVDLCWTLGFIRPASRGQTGKSDHYRNTWNPVELQETCHRNPP